MCFFIQSCEPLGGGKKERKKMHIPLWASCPTCLPFLPPLCTPQLTETCQWPTCMCWQPTSHHGFFPALTCWDRGEVLPLKLPWEPALTCAAGASPSGLCAIPTSPPSHNSPPRVPSPEHLPGLGSWQIFLQQLQKVISHQLPAGSLFSPPVSAHTCRLATVALCDAALFGRSRCTRSESALHKLHSLFLTRVHAAFPGWGKVQQAGGLPREA